VSDFDIQRVLEHLPHRYPFLLLDRVLSCVPGESIRALKNVTYNEPFFPGHFPAQPVMPGVLILESMAQATGVLAFRTAGKQPEDDTLYMLVGIDKARFKRSAAPGDQLLVDARLVRRSRGYWKFRAQAEVDGTMAAEAEILCVAQEPPRD